VCNQLLVIVFILTSETKQPCPVFQTMSSTNQAVGNITSH